MLVFDGHLDLAWNALQWGRDLTQPVTVIRKSPQSVVAFDPAQPGGDRFEATVSLPDMRRGEVGLCFATLLARSTGRPLAHIDWPTPEQACAIARGQLTYYRALEAAGAVRVIGDRADLEAAVPREAPGVVIAMEGADAILDPDDLPGWVRAGLRVIGLSHFGPGRYAGGTGTEEGLTPRGQALLRGMRDMKVILDVTHLADRAFTEVRERWDGPVLASHMNCRALVPNQRQGSDQQLRWVIERGGVIGSVLDGWMLKAGWERGVTTNAGVTLETVADHIDHICQLAGNAQHAAIGSDLDGGFGRDQSPSDLDTIADLQKLVPILAKRGYQEEDVRGILHGNWIALLRRAWA